MAQQNVALCETYFNDKTKPFCLVLTAMLGILD